jgi:hypothetical protein
LGVDYVEDSPEHAQAATMFALKRKSAHAECSAYDSRGGRIRCWLRRESEAVKSDRHRSACYDPASP